MLFDMNGVSYLDEFPFEDSGLLSVWLVRDPGGRLMVEIQHGEHGERFHRVPIATDATVASFQDMACRVSQTGVYPD
ncbi:hypothetical protein ACSDR0_43410 [Streptosporangium sp. G11]|uniref:hypothetical protein n=1 Tax=Streptosporangium sp. G11 TaxID=3436926 RepID=UPI003EB735DF